jgi:hypothetical protein
VIQHYLVAVRRGSTLFKKHFIDPARINLALLAQFVLEEGKSDTSRSTIVQSHHRRGGEAKSRFDFGNAGQAWELGTDTPCPKILCNINPLKRHKNGVTIRQILGRILDGMCTCTHHDLLRRPDVNIDRSFVMNQKRFEKFAKPLRDFLYAKESVTEWVTLQLLNLSHNQGGVRHMDVSNDPREGYNHTMYIFLTTLAIFGV